MSPRPDTHDSNSSAVVMATSSSQHHREHDEVIGVKDDASMAENPYLAGLCKRTRGLKKKMEKIKKTESLSASGKVSHCPCDMVRDTLHWV